MQHRIIITKEVFFLAWKDLRVFISLYLFDKSKLASEYDRIGSSYYFIVINTFLQVIVSLSTSRDTQYCADATINKRTENSVCNEQGEQPGTTDGTRHIKRHRRDRLQANKQK